MHHDNSDWSRYDLLYIDRYTGASRDWVPLISQYDWFHFHEELGNKGSHTLLSVPSFAAWKLSVMFAVAVLAASICFADVAQGNVQGRTVRATRMQEQPGIGDFVFTKLRANTMLTVECRLESSVVGLDPWWLKVHAFPSGSGYVPDFDVQCGNASPASHCDRVSHC